MCEGRVRLIVRRIVICIAAQCAVGKVTGNDRLEIEGKAEQIAGKAQAGIGKAKDAARDALKK